MGYRRRPPVYRLVFQDPEMEGLEVRMKSVTVGEFLELTGLDDTAALAGATLKDGAVISSPLTRAAGNAIVDWNLEDDNGPVQPGYDALIAQDTDFVRQIVKAWFEAVSGVSAPLQHGSSGGGPSPEGSLQLASASQSLAS
jgi:hypothetical protein